MMRWNYTCNNKNFINKLDALAEKRTTGQELQFNIPEIYNDYDFSLEPAKTFEELCKSHAQKIRNNYEKVHLWYSGGCDSHYILKIFLDNNIKIDQINLVRSGFSDADFEINDYAIPFIKKLGITAKVHEPMLGYYENFYIKKDKMLGTANDYWHHFRLNNHFENLEHHDTQGVAHIFGKEKPTIKFVNSKWYMYLLDVEVTPQPHQINFFLEDPMVHSKQCHMLKNAIENEKNVTEYNRVTFYNENQDFWNKSIGRYNGHKFPLKNLTKVNTFNKKDDLAIKQSPAEFVKAWKIRNLHLIKKYGKESFNNGDPALGTVGVFSNFYCLSENATETVDKLFPYGFNA